MRTHTHTHTKCVNKTNLSSAVWLSHVEAEHGGGLHGMMVPVRFSPETALCGNTHLVVTPGGERKEMERGGREDVMSLVFVSPLTAQYVRFNSIRYSSNSFT